ncbi:MAG: S-layer homology domain-containing protein [Candidatus Gracilibacteria bacterium]
MDISFAFRKIQKSITGLSILAILASLVSFTGFVSADTFPDVDSDHYAYDAVDYASDEGWMTGYDNGDFGVDDTLTRGQAAKILVLGSGLDTVDGCTTDFTDVPTTYDLYDYVCAAEIYGFVSGYTDADGDLTGLYGPNDDVVRAAFAKMVVEAFGLASVEEALEKFPDVEDGEWYEESETGWYVSTAWAWSVVNGYDNGNYYPAYDVTRGQAAIMINNAQDPVWRVEADDADDVSDVVSDGDLTVEVSSDSPDAMTIPYNATSVVLAAWDFTANGGDVVIDSLSMHQYGISTLGTSHQVYLYEGSTRLTSGTTVGSTNNEATFTYDIEIASGETRTITVRGENLGSASATGEVGMEIASASKLDVGDVAVVDGDFPLQGAKHTLSTTAAGSVTIEKNGSVNNAQVGEDGATIGKFKITSATEAAGVEELGIYLSGSVNTADVEDFNLYVSGADDVPLATVVAVDDLDVIRFDIEGEFDGESDECENSDGYCIAKGGSKSFYVTADFNTGRTDDTVKVYVDQSTDIFSRGALYGSGMQVVRTAYDGDSCTAATGDCSYGVLEGGDITISSNGPAAGDIATNGRDVALLDFTIVSITDVTFDSFPISLDASEAEATEGLVDATTANFTDIKIMDTDLDSALYAGVDSTVLKLTSVTGTTIDETTTGDAAQSYHLFTDDFSMAAGEELNLSLTADVRNLATLDGMTIVATLDLGATYPQLKDINNKTLTNTSVLVPASAVTGKTMTVRTPTLALSLASTPVANGTTYTKGSDDVEFTGIVMSCGNASDCRITSISLIGTVDETGATTGAATFPTTAGTPGIDGTINLNTIVGSVWLVDDEGNVVPNSEASVAASTGLVTMDNVDIAIDAGDSPVYTVVGDIKTDAYKSSDADGVAFKITVATNVTAEDEEGNTITPTGTVNQLSVTTASTWVVVSGGGSITVAVDADTPRENIAVAGTSDVAISTFKLTTTAEGFTVTKLAFNADQNGVAAGDLAEYDNQVSKVYLTYTDSSGAEVTEDASLVSGNVTFTSLDLYIGKNDSETVSVTADLNSIASGEATAGDHVRLDMAFNNFEALAEDSGETYKADKMDSAVDAASDLDFGTPTWTDSVYVIDGVQALTAVGTSQTLTVKTGTAIFPVGTLILTDTATAQTWTDGADSIFVLTAASTTTSMTGLIIDDDDASLADNLALSYSLPGDGYLTTTNPMLVYETLPTLTLSSSSPSGIHVVSSDDTAFIFKVTANPAELVTIRAAQEATAGLLPYDNAAANNTAAAVTTTAGQMVDGSGSLVALDNHEATDTLFVGSFAADVVDYGRVSFWMRYDGAAMPTFAALKTNVINTAASNPDVGGVALSATLCAADAASLVTTEWYRCDVAVAAAVAGEKFFSIELDSSAGLTMGADVLYIDDMLAYNDKIVIDLTTDENDISTYALNTSNAGAPSQADLKVGSSTKVSGFWDTFTNGASATSTATLTLIPTTAMEISKNTTVAYDLHIDSIDLLLEDGGSDDPVNFSIDTGSSSDTTVTAGDFWWYDSNAQVKWLGDVASKVSSNTLVY